VKASLLALLTCATCAACAPHPVGEPLRYPALPSAPSASTEQPAFDPAPGLARSPLSCRDTELPLPNALDDDCNGQVDGAPADEPLLLVLAYPQAAAIALFSRGDDEKEQALTAADCNAESAYCTVQLATSKLTRGRHALLARRADGDTSSQPTSVVVSIQSRGKVTTYLARLEAGSAELPLGQLALP
jgi:hypothetical protein